MFKVTSANLRKYAQSWMDEIQDVDWGDDDVEDRLVNENNLPEFLVDEVEESEELSPEPTPSPRPELPEQETEPTVPDYRDEIPTLNEILTPNAEREIIYPTADGLIDSAIERNEVIGFDYINRHGAYAGWRTVEPHYTFHAYTTGNMILVTWDRDINDIRAFIIGNIQPNGVRYEGETFDARSQIMIGVE